VLDEPRGLNQKAAPGFTIAAATPNTPLAAASDARRKLIGVQFHPEVHHTPWALPC